MRLKKETAIPFGDWIRSSLGIDSSERLEQKQENRIRLVTPRLHSHERQGRTVLKQGQDEGCCQVQKHTKF